MKDLNDTGDNKQPERNEFDNHEIPGLNFINDPITVEEIRLNVAKLSNGKACGLDKILNEHIKSSLHIMMPIYHRYFTMILDSGKIPKSWTEGCIVPIYKNKGAHNNPENYRPITLVSCLGKLFTSLLNNRLQKFAEEFSLIQNNQAGFRKKYSTVDHIFSLHMLINILNNQMKNLYCAFIDFQRAFDTVWRHGLWLKVLESKIRGKCFNVIYNLYQNIKSCIQVNGETSAFFDCNLGVRQGDNLSPFLFSLYLNDLEHFLLSNKFIGVTCSSSDDIEQAHIFIKLYALLYADDTILIADSMQELQHGLNIFHTYCKQWKLNVNISKTKVAIFGKGQLARGIKFFYNNTKIEIVSSFKYLGVYFNRSGSFCTTIKHIHGQANKALTVLLKRINHLKLPVDLQIDLFDRMIKPILLYASEVWGFSNCQLLERVHLRFLKSIFGMKSSTPNIFVYGEFGVFSIEIDIQTRMVAFWTKLIQDDIQKINNSLYDIVYLEKNIDKFVWLEKVKNILIKCGLNGFWEQQKVDSPIWLIKCVKQKLQDLFINEWYSKVKSSESSSNYRTFKTKFELEYYLQKLPLQMKKNLCLFRTRNHRLPIEIGNWMKLDISLCKCHLCFQDVGDEFHLLLCCQALAEERHRYIKRYYYTRPNTIKYNELINTRNIKELKNMCKLIKIILQSTNRT